VRGAGGARRGAAPHALLHELAGGGRRGLSYPDPAQGGREDGEPAARPRRGLSLRGTAAPLSSRKFAPQARASRLGVCGPFESAAPTEWVFFFCLLVVVLV